MIKTIGMLGLAAALGLGALAPLVAPARAQEAVAGPVLKEAYDLYQAGKLPDAAVKFEQGLRLNPARDQAAVAFFLLGETYRQLGDDFKAKANYEASIQANPNSQVAGQARDRLAGKAAAPALPPPPPPAATGLPPAPPPQQPPLAQGAPPTRRSLPMPPSAAGRPPAPPPTVAQRPAQPPPAQPPIDLFKPGTVIKDCEICPAMVVIPPGTFQMGSNSGDGDEKPVRPVTIPRPIAVGRFEVTYAEYDACLAAGGCRSNVSDNGWGRGTNPVVNVAWTDAMDYARWLSAATGKRYRLPSEAEWEYASRAGSAAAFPWGDEMQNGLANCLGCGPASNQTMPVGSFPSNGFGLFDTVGNVWEWTADCWNGTYAGAPTDGAVWMVGECDRRVVRGGAWGLPPTEARTSRRDGDKEELRSGRQGFRVARDLP